MQGLTNGIREASDPATLKQLLSSTRLVLRIFFSMNNPGLTEVRGPYSSSLFRPSCLLITCPHQEQSAHA